MCVRMADFIRLTFFRVNRWLGCKITNIYGSSYYHDYPGRNLNHKLAIFQLTLWLKTNIACIS